MSKYKNIMGQINYGLFLVLVALLPFPQILLRYAMGLWLISWLLEGRWWSKPKSLKENKMAIPFVLFGAWYIWKVISGFWANDLSAWSWQLERYMTFVLLVPVALWGVNERYDWKTAGKVLVGSCVIAVPAYLIWMTALHAHPQWVPYLNLPEEWIHHESWRMFVVENISFFKHRLFLCSIELFGAVIACQLFRKQWKILLPCLAVMLSVIPMTGSRQSVITVVLLAIILALMALPKGKRIRYGLAVIAVGLIIGVGLLKLHPRMQQFDWRAVTEMRDLSYNHDLRFNIWGAALQHPQDYWVYGLGAGQSSHYMVERFEEAHFDYYAQMKYHPHNQYLEELMEIGVGGLILFLLAWLSIPLCAKNKGRRTAVLFITLFLLDMLTDCIFGKFDGIALWAIGLLFVLLQSYTESEEQTSRDTQTH